MAGLDDILGKANKAGIKPAEAIDLTSPTEPPKPPTAPRAAAPDAGGSSGGKRKDGVMPLIEDLLKDPINITRQSAKKIEAALAAGAADAVQKAEDAVLAIDALVNIHYGLTTKQSPSEDEKDLSELLGIALVPLAEAARDYRARPSLGFRIPTNQIVDTAFIKNLANLEK